MEEAAVKVEDISKDFLLPHEGVNSIKGIITGLSKGSPWRTKETQHALEHISFEIKKGEFFGIVGRNGSGKSTLLKILAGIYQPTSGKTYTKGKLVPFIELGVGFNPELTGRENVYLNGAMLGLSEKETTAIYDDIVAFAELKRFMDQKLKNYSSGMQVRLAFSMATRANADILLIDEVLAVGDADFQRKCFEYFKSLKKNKKTVVFVSHDMDAVRKYCDRAAFIEKSKLVAVGPSSDVSAQYTKMFFEKISDSSAPVSENRWGILSGSVTSVIIPKRIGSDMKTIPLTINIQAEDSLEDSIIGYMIKNSFGQIITGTNTDLLSVKTGRLSKGEKIKLTFNIENIFSDGNYDIDVALIKNDGVTVLDWWESAVEFNVFQARPSNYLVSPRVDVKVLRDNDE